MRNLTRLVGAALAVTFSFAGWSPTQAHHSFAMYDTSKPEAITGVLVRTNPDAFHYQLFIAQLNPERTKVIRDAAGDPVIWVVEMEGAGQVASEGVTEANFPAGTIVSIGFYPLRNGDPGGTRNQFGFFRCPDKTAPAAGKMCDQVEGGQLFGEGELPPDEGSI